MRNKKLTFSMPFLLFLCTAILSGCGSDSSDPAPATTLVSGTVSAGPVDGGTIEIKDDSGSVIAGPANVVSGAYTVAIMNTELNGDLVIESTGGTFIDEATGIDTTAGTLAAHIQSGQLSGGAAVHITPATTISRHLIAAGKTPSEAETLCNDAFGYSPDMSIEPEFTSAADETDAGRLAALQAAALSQLTMDLGLAPTAQFSLLSALAEDLADGALDGSGAASLSLPADIQSRFCRALVTQKNNMNISADKIGILPFSKLVITDNYTVRYIPGTMQAMQGRTMFTISVTDLNGNPAPGLTLAVNPTMYMATMNHSTPIDAILDNGDGTYTCTIYYLMASAMNGNFMGYWELKVTANGDDAYFYPPVMMAMGDTTRGTLKDANDKIAGMMGQDPQVRSYYVFKESYSGTSGNHTIRLFIAARESMMMHPAVSTGSQLTDETGTFWTVNTMSVELSLDDGANWTAMTDDGSGHWSATGVAGLTSGQTTDMLVSVTINGTEKTTDGTQVGSPASFTLTAP